MENFAVGQEVFIDTLDDSDSWELIGLYPGDELGNTYNVVYFSNDMTMIAVFEMDSAYAIIEEFDDSYANWLRRQCEEDDE